MNQALVDKVVAAVLYEGFILYPYRPSPKNRNRWTFGGLFPESGSLAREGAERAAMQTQCLLRGSPASRINVEVRFLHLIARTAGELERPLAQWPAWGEPAFRAVASLRVGDQVFHTWQEAEECRAVLESCRLGDLLVWPRVQTFAFAESRAIEPLPDPAGGFVGLLERRQEAVVCAVEASAREVEAGLFQLTVRVINRTPAGTSATPTRDEAAMAALVSTNAVLGVEQGEFISAIDPPEPCRAAANQCKNDGVWPVLVGTGTEHDTMLASPIILYDYPQIAAESSGDFFDATEIDEMLSLRILTMTDEEKRSMAGIDARTRAMLERTEAAGAEHRRGVYGTWRAGNAAASGEASGTAPLAVPLLSSQLGGHDGPRPTSVRVAGRDLKAGDHVRLRPRGRADIFDIALKGMAATITSIEQDFEGRVHVAVTVDDDPGKEWAHANGPGHRFFFTPEELEPLGKPAGSQA